MNMKKNFLVIYDYGTGGVWAIIKAPSKGEITQKYPMLSVEEKRPNWMTDDYYNQVASARTFDIDDPPTGWLLTVMKSK
jgi:hypothetical protein